VGSLDGGASVLVAGQLSERWVVEGDHSCRRGFILASLVRPEPSADRVGELLIPGRHP
jgi:hypothetical protein